MLNQKGMVPIIYVIASVVLLSVFVAIFFQFSKKSDPKQPSTSPKAASLTIPASDQDCTDRDYTGCDGVEVFTWTDDGERNP